MKEWKEYFEDLLHVKSSTSQMTQLIPPAENDLPINIDPFTTSKVSQAAQQLKNEKAPGLDYAMTVKILKYSGRYVPDKLCEISNEVFENQQTPKQLNNNI